MSVPGSSLREQGLQALQAGELDKAVDFLARAVMANDADADAKAMLGIAYAQKGLHTQAKRALQTAIELQPENANYRFNLGVALERAGDLPGAAVAYRDTLQLNKDHGQARAKLQAMGPQAHQWLAQAPKPVDPVGVPTYNTPHQAPPTPPGMPGGAPPVQPPPGAMPPPGHGAAPFGQPGYPPPPGGQAVPPPPGYAPPGQAPPGYAPPGYAPPVPPGPAPPGYAPPVPPGMAPPGYAAPVPPPPVMAPPGMAPPGYAPGPTMGQGPPGTVQCPSCQQWSKPGMVCEHCMGALPPPPRPQPQPTVLAADAPGALPPGAYSAAAVHYQTEGYGTSSDMGGFEAFGLRWLAVIIDHIILNVITIPLALLFGVSVGLMDLANQGNDNPIGSAATSASMELMINLVVTGIFIMYDTAMHAIWGRTLGKMVFGLHVVDEMGDKVGWLRCLFRATIGRLVGGCICGMGYWSVLWNDEQRGWHDQICGTHVVKR